MVAGAILTLVLLFSGVLVYLSVTEYRPGESEEAETGFGSAGALSLDTGRDINILSMNIGYGGLSSGEDFFMDGGKTVRPGSAGLIEENLAGIKRVVDARPWDFVMLQEVDKKAKRSYGIDETAYLSGAFPGTAAFVPNFRCAFVPFPFPQFIGPVDSGLFTMSRSPFTGAARVSLPVPFAWPVRMANLKRCLLVTRYPAGGRELVLVNLHLEAYSSGEGREAQTRVLMDFLRDEYAKGNWCVAGGDFNQNFPGAEDRYPLVNTGDFEPGVLDTEMLDGGWSFAYDASTPTCRLLDKPYDAAGAQHYVIDGYILSPNVILAGVETLNEGFRYSDHNPVALRIRLAAPY
jgi:endonuclease/exonuclease/phosphatase family metal-dependent hydrolase